MSFSCEFDLSEFYACRDRSVSELGTNLWRAVTKAAGEGRDEAKAVGQFKDHTGKLRGDIYAKTDFSSAHESNAWIISPTSYSWYVEAGTGPHDIRPKEGHGFVGPLLSGQSRRAKTDIGTHRVALRFVIGGRTIFASVVHHPGGRPYPFFGPAYIKAEAVLYAQTELGFITVASIWD